MPAENGADRNVSLCDASFPDDVAWPLVDPSPGKLLRRMAVLGCLAKRACEEVFLRPNWRKGKTEVVFALRGQGARGWRKRLLTETGRAPVLPLALASLPDARSEDVDFGEGGHAREISVAYAYRHLGMVLRPDAALVHEARSRAGQSYAAIGELRKTLAQDGMKRQVKLDLVDALVLSRLVYGLATWIGAAENEYAKLEAAAGSAWICAMRLPPKAAGKFTAEQVRRQAGRPSVRARGGGGKVAASAADREGGAGRAAGGALGTLGLVD